jgi:DNA-directed RNA polymerase subunit M/transcription elongation factor TFIIS
VKPDFCPACGTGLHREVKNTDEKSVTIFTCQKCGYSKTNEYFWAQKQDEGIDTDFANDRDRFCLTEEGRKQYQQEKWRLEQMGKLVEEFKKTEEARNEKLKEYPDGFHLEGRGYTCPICKTTINDAETWYDGFGLSCLHCRDARRNGIIPDSVFKDKESWYGMWEFDYYFKAKSATVHKFIRNGKLKGRVIPNQDGKVHFELFLISENQGFLPPKPKSRMVTTDDDFSHTEHERIDSPFVLPPKMTD